MIIRLVPKCDQDNCHNIINGKALSCGHYLCNGCQGDAVNSIQKKCPCCKKNLQTTKKMNEDLSWTKRNFNNFKEHCNNFFMYIINNYSFQELDGNQGELIDFVWSCVTDESKDKSSFSKMEDFSFDDIIDPNPVLRSFTLQRIFKASEQIFSDKLSEFFQNSGNEKNYSTVKMFNFTICSCIEDFWKMEKVKHPSKIIKDIKKYDNIWNLKEKINSNEHIKLLNLIGSYRFILQELAKTDFLKIKQSNHRIKIFIEANDLTRQFFLKCLYKHHGIEKIIQLNQIDGLDWLIPHRAIPTNTHPDVFVLYTTDVYKKIRNCLDSGRINTSILNTVDTHKHLWCFALYSTLSSSKNNKLNEQVEETVFFFSIY